MNKRRIKSALMMPTVFAFVSLASISAYELSNLHGASDYEIVSNVVHPTIKARTIDVFLESKSFTEQNLSELIKEIDGKFCEPFNLAAVIFSDREMLEWFRRGQAADIVNFNTSTADGRRSQAEFISKIYPPSTGYHKAFYYRNNTWEYFEYTPDANSVERRRVVIRDTTGRLQTAISQDVLPSRCKVQ